MEGGTVNWATPHWRSLYAAAVLELDPHKVPQRIAAAESAITSRMGELKSSESSVETQELMNAISVLHDLRKIERVEKDGSAAA